MQNSKKPSELFLSDKTTKEDIQACIDADMFSHERYPTAVLDEDFGILNVPTKNIFFDIHPQTGEVIQKYRAGLPLFNDYLENKLPRLFENGFDFSKPIGYLKVTHKVLDKNGKLDVEKSKFEPISATHRSKFYQDADISYMAFRVVDADYRACGIIGLKSNIDAPKAILGKPNDIVNYVMTGKDNGEYDIPKSKEEEVVKQIIEEIMGQSATSTKKMVVKNILESLGVESRIRSLTAGTIKSLHKEYPNVWSKYELGMKYSDYTKSFGTTFTKGYADNTFYDAIKRYIETYDDFGGIGTTANVYVVDSAMNVENPWLSRARIVDEYNETRDFFNKLLDFARENPKLKIEEVINLGVAYPQINRHETFDTESPNEEIPLNHIELRKALKKVVKERQKQTQKRVNSIAKGLSKCGVQQQQQVNETLSEVLSMNLENFAK
jgi:hypothetical protein